MLGVRRLFAGAGGLLLQARLRQRPDASQSELFADLWALYWRFNPARKLQKYFAGLFYWDAENTAFVRIWRVVKLKYPNYKPDIQVVKPELVRTFVESAGNIIILTVHNLISTAVVEFVQSSGRPCTLISAQFSDDDFLKLLGTKEKFTTIYPDDDVLLKARRALHEGRAVCCHPDSVTRGTFSLARQFRIDTGIFEFARKMDAQIFYVITQVSDAGTIVVHLDEPAYPSGSRDAAGMAQDFIAFLDATLRTRRKWLVD